MDQEKFKGTGVALVTPLINQVIDQDATRQLVDYVINRGVDYLVVLGSTGEASLLSNDEQRQVLDLIIEFNAGRKPIVAGNFGGSSTRDIVQKIKRYHFNGIDALLCSSPAYVKPTQEGIYAHYARLSECSDLPIIMYNVPGRTASNMNAETTLRLASDFENIIAIKEASNDLSQIEEIGKNKPNSFLLLSGDDQYTLPILNLGGEGVISVIANAFPQLFSQMVKYALGGNSTAAESIHDQLLNIHPFLYVEGNPTGIKAALEYLEICSREVRLPLLKMSEKNFNQLINVIKSL